MRHIGTVIAAVIVGPLAWVLFALGQDRSARAFATAQEGAELTGGDFVRPALVLAGAGILLGLIATLRFSPLGAALTGLCYSASYLGLLVSPKSWLNLFDHHVTVIGQRVDLATPVRSGTTLLVGALLLVGVVSVRRWQRWPQPAAPESKALLPDDVLPPTTERNRPLGVDGLGLTSTRPTPEPARAGDRDWAGLSSAPADRFGRSTDWRQPTR
jgi:hypothetical protein